MSKGWKNNFVKVKGAQVKNKQRRGEKVTQLSLYLHRLTFQNIFSPGLSPYLQRLTLQSIFSPGFVEASLYKMPKWWNMRTACIFILCIWGGPSVLFQSNEIRTTNTDVINTVFARGWLTLSRFPFGVPLPTCESAATCQQKQPRSVWGESETYVFQADISTEESNYPRFTQNKTMARSYRSFSFRIKMIFKGQTGEEPGFGNVSKKINDLFPRKGRQRGEVGVKGWGRCR